MKWTHALLAAILGMTSVAMAEDSKSIKAATVNIDEITQAVGYENVGLLWADKETRSLLSSITSEMKKLYVQIIDQDDEIKAQPLQEKYDRLEKKATWIKQKLQQRNSRDYRKALQTFIKQEFGSQYPIIAVSGQTPERYGMIQFDVTFTDITDDVIRRMEEILK